MKKLILIAISLVFLGVGCKQDGFDLVHQKDITVKYATNLVGDEGYELDMYKQKVDKLEKQIQMLIEAGGYVDWEEYEDIHPKKVMRELEEKHGYNFPKKTILTNDPLKKEYIEKQCDTFEGVKYGLLIEQQCKELKQKLNL